MASTLPILTFHDISSRQSVISFAPELFRNGIARLHARGYKTLNLTEAIDLIRDGTSFPHNSFGITFDDGYQGVYKEAFPVLQEYGMTATVFITLGKEMISESSARPPSFMGRTMLSWKEIREMRSHDIDFGAHTLTHPDLTGLPLEHARDEIHYSKTAIEDALGYSVASFAYPFGRYNRQIIDMVKEHFSCAFTDKLGLVNRKSNQYEIERVDAYYLRTNRSFNLILTRLFPWYIKARNIPRTMRRRFNWKLYQ